MIADAAALMGLAESALWHGFLVFLRISALMSLLPAFGEHSIPMRVKLALAVSFTLVVAMSVTPFEQDGMWAFPTILRYALTETMSGFLMGIGVRLILMALQMAGSIAAQATSLSQAFGGAGMEPLPALGHVLTIGGLALAAMAGLHIRAVAFMILSYDLLPAGQFPSPVLVAQWGIPQVANAFSLGFTLAAPFVIISVLYNLTLGVINRAMPQLMVAFVGAPVITAGSLILLMLLSPLMLSLWLQTLTDFLSNPVGGMP